MDECKTLPVTLVGPPLHEIGRERTKQRLGVVPGTVRWPRHPTHAKPSPESNGILFRNRISARRILCMPPRPTLYAVAGLLAYYRRTCHQPQPYAHVSARRRRLARYQSLGVLGGCYGGI